MTLPDLGPTRARRAPATAERTLGSGLQVLAVRRASVPLVELRLRIPFAGRESAHQARSSVLAAGMLFGTAQRDELQLAEALQEVGSELSVAADADRLHIGGAVLRSGLGRLLDLLAELLTGAAYPARPVLGERDRLAEQLVLARAQPGVIAGEARAHQLFGAHPYGQVLPSAEQVGAVTPAAVRRLHRDRVQPDGSVLVLVGDLSPARTLDLVERSLAGWAAAAAPPVTPAVPPIVPGPLVLVDRPGSVQSSLRLGGAALRRPDEGYAALQLANLIFGGYFSSRYVANIREDKGYSYTPRSRVDQRQAGASFLIDADVANAVSAPALLETRYELGRMATLPVRRGELDDARQYALGSLALSTSTQSGLAAQLAAVTGQGLGPDWLATYRRQLLAVTPDDVAEQAACFLAPSRLVTVVVGDAARIEPQLVTLAEVVRS